MWKYDDGDSPYTEIDKVTPADVRQIVMVIAIFLMVFGTLFGIPAYEQHKKNKQNVVNFIKFDTPISYDTSDNPLFYERRIIIGGTNNNTNMDIMPNNMSLHQFDSLLRKRFHEVDSVLLETIKLTDKQMYERLMKSKSNSR